MFKRVFVSLMLLSVVLGATGSGFAAHSVLARGETASRPPDYHEIARIGGDVFQVSESGGVACAAIGADFVVFDVSSASPAMLYRGDILPGTPSVRGLTVSGGYAYVLEDGMLDVIDVQTPSSPVLAAQSALSVTWDSVAQTLVSGDLYVLVYEEGGTPTITLVDISDPLHPLQKGTYQDTGESYDFDVAIGGNYVYAATFANKVLILDISDPAAPTRAAAYDTASPAVSVAVEGNYLYLNEGGSRLKILELTQPLAPNEVGTYSTGFDKVSVEGEKAYLFDFFSTPARMEVVDVSVPGSPVSEGSTNLPDSYASWFQGSVLYLADSTGLSRWDFNASPALTHGYIYRHVLPDARDMALRGDYLLVAGGLGYAGDAEPRGLWVVDVSSPSAPAQVASLPLADTVQNVSDLDVQGNLAAIAESRGVHLVDVTRPLTPTLLADFSASLFNGNPQVVISGTYLFAGDTDSTYVVDISSPMTPTGVVTFTDSNAWGTFALQGNFAYANSDTSGFRIFDISDPANPVLQGAAFLTPSGGGLAVAGDYAYLGNGSQGSFFAVQGCFFVVDVSSPSHPSLVDTISVPAEETRITRLEVASGRLYVYGESGAVYIYALDSPAAPAYLTALEAPVVDVLPDGNTLYVAKGSLGVSVLQDIPYRTYLPLTLR